MPTAPVVATDALFSPFTAEGQQDFKHHLLNYMALTIKGTRKYEEGERLHIDVQKMIYDQHRLMYVTAGARNLVTVHYNQEVKSPYSRDYLWDRIEVDHERDNTKPDEEQAELVLRTKAVKVEERGHAIWDSAELKLAAEAPGVLFSCSRHNLREGSGHRTCMLWTLVAGEFNVYYFNGNGLAPSATMSSKDVPTAYLHIMKVATGMGLGGIKWGGDGNYPYAAKLDMTGSKIVHGLMMRSFKGIGLKVGRYNIHVWHEFRTKQVGYKDCKRHTANTIARLLCTTFDSEPYDGSQMIKANVEKTWNVLDGLALLRQPGGPAGIEQDNPNYQFSLQDDFQMIMQLYDLSQTEEIEDLVGVQRELFQDQLIF